MKITNVSSQIVNVSELTNWIFVFIETDEGVSGIGEATLDGFEHAVSHAIDHEAIHLIGKDPLQTRIPPMTGFGGMIQASAISGLDQALWDLKGKILGVPVYQLLGGAMRERIPMYANVNRACKDRTPDGFAQIAAQAISSGYTAVKCAPFDGYVWRESIGKHSKIEAGIERLMAVRQAIGEQNELHVECHWRFDAATAIQIGQRIRAIRPFWFEAPIREQHPRLMHQIKVATGLNIAGGEMQINPEQYVPLLLEHSMDIYMPDIKYIGGVTGLMKAAAVIEAHDLYVAPHNPSGPVATAATLHAAAAINNLLTVEYQFGEADWGQELARVDVQIKDGTVTLPQGPGFGVTFDTELAKKHPYQKVTSPIQHHRF
jgi:galactonate dehydratase